MVINQEEYLLGWLKARWAVIPTQAGWAVVMKRHLDRVNDPLQAPPIVLHEFPDKLEDIARHVARVHNDWHAVHHIDEEGSDNEDVRAATTEDRASES